MPTVIVEDEPGARRPLTGFVPPTIRPLLQDGFEPEASFHVYDGRPYVVWGMWDHAEDWSSYPVRSCHPYAPHWYGLEINEAEFRALVRAMHAIEGS
jgi:hypothetical protein